MIRTLRSGAARRRATRPSARLSLQTLEARDVPAAFDAGNLVLYRVGDGTNSLVATGNAVFLDEYTPAGVFVRSHPLPTADPDGAGPQRPLIAGGTATAEGYLSRSIDGEYLVMMGYGRDLVPTGSTLSSSSPTTVPRVVGIVAANGTTDTTTGLTNMNLTSPRSAASTNGTDLWVATQTDGVKYTTRGATTATGTLQSGTNTTMRTVNIFGGQLYATHNDAGDTNRIGPIGTGLPTTTGQTYTGLPGDPVNAVSTTGSTSPYAFFMADTDATEPGLDTLYVANDDAAAIKKYTLSGGTWTHKWTFGTDQDYRGLTGVVNGGQVDLYIARGVPGASEFVKLVDAGGFNGTTAPSGTAFAIPAGTNKVFRGVALSPQHTNVAPVNTLPATFSATEDTDKVLSGISVADADAGTDPVVVTLSVPSGILKVGTAVPGGLTAGQVTNNNSGAVTITAPIAAINATLADAAGLTFSPATNATGAVTLTMTADDQGSFGNAPPNTPLADTDQATITVTAVNDGPTNTIPGSQFTAEDTDLVFSAGNGNLIQVGDVDAGTGAVKVTLTASQGTVTLGGTTSLTVTGNGTAEVVATGTVADLNAGLAGLTFTPAPNFNGSASLGVLTDDQGNTGAGGPATRFDLVFIVVGAVNDAPVAVVPGDQFKVEDTPFTFTPAGGNRITVADVDAGAGLRLTLTAPDGTVTLSGTAGLTGVSGNGTGLLTATGTPADLNAALDGLIFTPAPNFNGLTTLRVDVNDQGNTGNGGAQSSFMVVAIHLAAVNDAPVNVGPGGPTVAPAVEDTEFAFAGDFGFFVNDADAGTGLLSTSLTATHGTITVSEAPGVTVTGNGTAAITVTGALDDLNAALFGLTFMPDADYFGPASIDVLTGDQGNAGSGGPLTDADTFAINVAAVNDAPAFGQATYTFFLNGAITAGTVVGQVAATDVEGNGISYALVGDARFAIDATGKITVADPTGLAGTYTLTATATDDDPTDPQTGSATVTVTLNSAPTTTGISIQTRAEDSGLFTLALPPFFADAQQDPATLDYSVVVTANPGLFATAVVQGTDLKLTPAANANGSATVEVTATDEGGLSVTTAFTFTVTAVNDVPTVDPVADPATVAEDAGQQTVNLTGLSAGPADEAGQTLTVTATSSHPNIVPNPTVTFAGGPTATVNYAPVANAFGTATITVTVSDGTATTVETFDVTVDPAADRPVIDTSFTPMLPPIKMPIPRGAFPTAAPITTLVANVTDADPTDPRGVAITAADTTGTWQYTTNGGATWDPFPTGLSEAAPFLLMEDGQTQVRFLPNKRAPGVKAFPKGFAGLTYRAWDGTVELSAQSERAWVAVGKTTPAVDAAGHPLLKAIREDVRQSPAYVVKNVLGLLAKETDPTRVFGIAVSGATGTGAWEFNTGKSGWLPLGAVSDTSAVLLRPTDRVRFKPGRDFDGDARLTYHTWDLATGNPGDQANVTAGGGFSAATETAILDVIAVNDAPVLDTTPNVTVGPVAPGGQLLLTVSTLLNGAATDVETAAASIGIQALPGTGGTWEYSLDGVVWTRLTRAVYLAPTAQLRFTADKPGATTATLRFKAWDATAPKPTSLSRAVETLTVTIQ